MTATENSAAVDRNPAADRMCQRLAPISWGRAAREVITDGTSGPARVHVLPVFAWVEPADGRKANDGKLHAIKISWDGGPVRVVPGTDEVDVQWTAKGLGLTLRGAVRLCEGSGAPDPHSPPLVHRSPLLAAPAAAERLQTLSDDAEINRWEAMMLLDTWVGSMSSRLNRSISMEVTDGETGAGVLDREQLAETVTTVVFGNESKKGRMWSALDRVTDPDSGLAVDPIHYLSTEATRSLSEGIRDKIGDPQIGPKIRRLARHLGIGVDLDTLVDEYRRLYPGDRLGRARAIRALTSAPRLEVGEVSLRDGEGEAR